MMMSEYDILGVVGIIVVAVIIHMFLQKRRPSQIEAAIDSRGINLKHKSEPKVVVRLIDSERTLVEDVEGSSRFDEIVRAEGGRENIIRQVRGN
ncbi:hypothetical protein [Archaeoglobus profundus]|uniref:Uncharacterized protein n=1 Tax=Archaeoglobus profundus (strain DSM 5631 / JCM 9629 / NBRC 100127 / Av18) TaxID=572546 RepID=D2REV6_ARCPA|nr:hypothetical protein [Archaeoglobus profundus]ADB58650.1 hypothetical protein Arcpr_1604 [Archaeoglobus profundus DSM 5631]